MLIEIEVKGAREWVEESTLVKKTGVSIDDENERSTYEEWYQNGVLVKRNAHVTLKKWPQAQAEAGSLT